MTETQTPRVTFEVTPNPATLKFLLYRKVTDLPFECVSPAEAERSPLAAKIFGFPWTQSIYLGPNFITVTKYDWVDWKVLAEPLSSLIQEHLDRGEEIVSSVTPASRHDINENDSQIVREIKALLNREIRPVVALDGGDILFSRYDDHILYLKMKGACAGCPSSSATLKDGVEVRMKEAFPEIREVVAE